MKKAIMTLLMLVGLAYGQSENNVLKLTYLGYDYTQQGHRILITNKVACDIVIELRNGAYGAEAIIPASKTQELVLKSFTREVVQVRKIGGGACLENGSNGWVTLQTPIVLPVTFKSVTAKRIGMREIVVEFIAAEDMQLDHYNVQVSLNGKDFKNVKVIFPEGNVIGEKKYTAKVVY